ncbi:phosphofructokinase [Mycobacterium phage Lamina13]|uniref:phosphofructokinase n=1 Tax=Mycobacterium phage Lamina13 TaxID=1468169 RepID=UPI00043B12E9|nr:phosphofructokinase [Mycobacterium phage Lamina13]YP_009197633.1 phosphofructokinase [Mycobacterium phage Tasp14]AHN84468.1 hypothetical protein PBI_LAMINA13_54 [Mycobacterium phage Lamina13]ALA11945.1 hypothetical protein SEA_TASP14_55 [Mycobacterium phage Tasp14]
MTESILEEAQRLIHGPRNKNYGHPRENFADISALFSAYLERPITDLDVANLMILVKVARVKGTGYHRDSYTDIAGYAGCAERIYEEDPRIEIPIDLDSGVSSDWLFDECEEPEPVEEDDQLALFDLPLPDDLIRNENEDSLSWVDALNDITYSDGEDEDALVDLDEPRVWKRIQDVPTDVVVRDADGDTFHWVDGELYIGDFPWGWVSSTFNDSVGPFTEVVE